MLTYQTTFFNDLSPQELYELMQLRSAIFVVEQNCVYHDADGKDLQCWHVIGKNANGKVMAYCRLVPLGISYEKYTSIGRVVVDESCRAKKEGHLLMQYAIEQILELWPKLPIKISAQAHLQSYYAKHGFVTTGDGYLEDDIPHVAMVRVS